MRNCKNCKFWNNEWAHEVSEITGNVGECENMMPNKNGGIAEASCPNEGIYTSLFTREDFGCVLFAEGKYEKTTNNESNEY